MLARYGTHYVDQVVVGGRVELEASVETCVTFAALQAHTDGVTAIELALADGAATGMESFDGVYVVAGAGAPAADTHCRGVQCCAEIVLVPACH